MSLMWTLAQQGVRLASEFHLKTPSNADHLSSIEVVSIHPNVFNILKMNNVQQILSGVSFKSSLWEQTDIMMVTWSCGFPASTVGRRETGLKQYLSEIIVPPFSSTVMVQVMSSQVVQVSKVFLLLL